MKCPKCKSEAAPDARFCGECGNPLTVSQEGGRPEVDFGGLRTIDSDEAETRNPRGPSQRTLQPKDTFAQRYVISALIGEGGMGAVYRAHDQITDKDVALKLIRADRLAGKDAVKRLIREGVTSRDIRHPNVVAVYDVSEADGQPYMSMEFLDGRSLRAWNRARMQSGADCSMKTAANIVHEIMGGLEAAHRVGVVHRDLKPENVMLLTEPDDTGVQLKLLDFGIARGAAGDTSATSLGTRGYMAPEQITAPDAAQPSADLYSLSVMFYELLVGVVPQGHWQPPSGGRSDVPIGIDQLIQKGLSNNPRTRPQSVGEYSRALTEAMKTSPPRPATAGGASQPWLQKLEQTDLKPLVAGIRNTTEALRKTAAENLGQKPVPPPLTGQPVASANAPRDWTVPPRTEAPSPVADMPPVSSNLWTWFVFSLTRRYASGAGRACRKEFWAFVLFSTLIAIPFGILDPFWQRMNGVYMAQFRYEPQLVYLPALALACPWLTLLSRRFHDLGQSGWWGALGAIPQLGLLLLALGLPDGQPRDNLHGPDPLGRGEAGIAT